jgi:two-component system, chemotaxis family, protein-glutamate methylesterase/glutaminase
MPETAKVLIVDDSRIFRALIEDALQGQEGITVAGSVFSGEKALEFIRATPPAVVTLDVEMPGMDGLQTLEEIQQFNAARTAGTEVGVIMVSAHTKRGADVTIKALQSGAFDFVTKPSGPNHYENLNTLRQQLLTKIRMFLGRRARAVIPAPIPAMRPVPPAARTVRAVAIAASTGGPRALEILLPELCGRITVPILVVQHLPSPFTQSLAENLSRRCSAQVLEAQNGDPLRPGIVYVAPGGKHLLIRQENGLPVAGINEQPPENRCRPSADVLFRSAAAVFGGEAVALVLTGMGCDGTAGLRALKRAGGYAIAQDEASSVVWGMPGSVVEAGLADEVLPLERIAAAVQVLVAGRGVK